MLYEVITRVARGAVRGIGREGRRPGSVRGDRPETLKQSLAHEMLPQIDFRISLDFGNVTTLQNKDWTLDLVGPTINTCAKINGCCPINGMVLGSRITSYNVCYTKLLRV